MEEISRSDGQQIQICRDDVLTLITELASHINVKRLFVFLFLATLAFGANGTFVGQVISGPNADTGKKWIYVQGPRGAVRIVDVSAAKVRYGAGVTKKDRAEDAVREGAQVRITASQDREGEWKASRVEVVKSAPR